MNRQLKEQKEQIATPCGIATTARSHPQDHLDLKPLATEILEDITTTTEMEHTALEKTRTDEDDGRGHETHTKEIANVADQ